MVGAVGREARSICEDAGEGVRELASAMVRPRARFALASTPDTGSLVVRVDDAPRADWVYDPDARAVVFPVGSEPGDGATVRIDYQALCLAP